MEIRTVLNLVLMEPRWGFHSCIIGAACEQRGSSTWSSTVLDRVRGWSKPKVHGASVRTDSQYFSFSSVSNRYVYF
jgi:hypothetical protein